jgi:hypothetical protein
MNEEIDFEKFEQKFEEKNYEYCMEILKPFQSKINQ